jgi:hypothetical protein
LAIKELFNHDFCYKLSIRFRTSLPENICLLYNLQRLILVSLTLIVSLTFCYRTDGYTSINPILMVILMGLRQIYPEKHLDTRIPFITGNLLISFKVLHYFSQYLKLSIDLTTSIYWFNLLYCIFT